MSYLKAQSYRFDIKDSPGTIEKTTGTLEALPGGKYLLQYQQRLISYSQLLKIEPSLLVLSQTMDSIIHVDKGVTVTVTGYSSIEGDQTISRQHAKDRSKAVYQWLVNSTSLDPASITIRSNGSDWKLLRELVNADANVPQKQAILHIIDSNSSFESKQSSLRSLGSGSVWNYLLQNIFPAMRIAEISVGKRNNYVINFDNTVFSNNSFLTHNNNEDVESNSVIRGMEKSVEELPLIKISETVIEDKNNEIEEEIEIIEENTVYKTEKFGYDEAHASKEPASTEENELEYWIRKFYIKTNVPAWAALMVNAALEIDLAPHWSLSLPVYYAGWDYILLKNWKFRNITIVPEVRWYSKRDNTGFFINLHAGASIFNYAHGGEWRYQTYDSRTPAYGGGIGIGGRWYISPNHHWCLELALGGGAYHLDYNIFRNVPNGSIVGRKKRMFYGVDQAAVSFCYCFGVQTKVYNR